MLSAILAEMRVSKTATKPTLADPTIIAWIGILFLFYIQSNVYI